jgi:cytosine/adenosine deaminase-related metal-dependent hydrolase
MRFISADKIFSGREYLPANSILVLNKNTTITAIAAPGTIDKNKVEHYEGIICPGFINTHCHLELSHLKGAIKQHTGIVDFGLNIIKHRNGLPAEVQLEYMQQADKDMLAQGIVAVGDISNTAQSLPVKQNSSLYYHTFVELIALNPERAQMVFDAGKNILGEFEAAGQAASLAPHAPYSTSFELIRLISDHCYRIKKPTSIHNQESRAENEFFETASGDYLRLYSTLNIPIGHFKATRQSSLQTVLPSFKKGVNTLLVHNTFTNQKDLEMAQNVGQNLYWCLCPNANLYIENTLPDIALLNAFNCTLSLGTDSLASNLQLSITEEINTILKHQANIPTENLLQAATYNGARFLGLENEFGLLEKNKKPGLNLLEGTAGNYKVKKLA